MSVRIRVISYILKETRYGEQRNDKGVERLIQMGVYEDAFPLHDGNISLGTINFCKSNKILTEN